ncbi:hypothetical protein [Geoalkalibacter sp.]|uniref:hypothetical protein n=1 Tax=Geoalkalibacter sp. TaxID=3041440 RepID=UPI00272DEA5A|nr:hypothetical protein [Geoalkalibacter sp.]
MPAPFFRSIKSCPLGNQRGAMLLVVLVAVVILGIGSAMTGVSWTAASQRVKEQELLWVGQQYYKAIESFYHTDFAGRGRESFGSGDARQQQRRAPGLLPNSIEELLRDPRAAQIVRHLRKPYKDPMTGEDFVLIKDPGGRIRGVRSSSTLTPFKTENFPPGLEKLAGADSYAKWEFAFEPPASAQPAGGVSLDGRVPTIDPSRPGGPGPGGPGPGGPDAPEDSGRPTRDIRRCIDPTPCPPGEDCIFDPAKCAFIPYVPSWKMPRSPGGSEEYGR